MITKQNAKRKMGAAKQATSQALKARDDAHSTLGRGVAVNGYGIVRDPAELRSNLWDAHDQIKAALRALDNVDWPADADYDLL